MKRFSALAVRMLTVLLAGIVAACSGLTYFAANAPTVVGSYRRVADLAYGSDPRERLDVYSPKEAGKRPVVIFLYGGSWTMGSRSQYRFVGAALASRGFVTVIPDYRLYPQVRFPQLMDDPANAVAWVRQHAAQFGGDPDRLALMGHSAGAHMAALLVLNDEYLVKAGVRTDSVIALVGLSGPYVLKPNTDTLWKIFAPPSTPADWQPVRFASDRSPPTLLIHCMDDKLVYASHTEKLRDALISHGVPVETHLYPKCGHIGTIGSFTLILRGRTPALEQTVSFLRNLTGRSDPSH